MERRRAEGRGVHDRRVIIATALAFAALVANFVIHYHRGSLIYDEGDYYVAVSNGFWNNWFDADDVPITTFVGAGLRAVRGEAEQGELSRMIRASGSTAFNRHYHPPFAFYVPIAATGLAPQADPEHQLRTGNFVLMALFIAILGLVALRYPDTFSPWIALLPASANWIASAGGFNMHIPFGLAATLGFMLWYAREQHPDRLWLRRGTIAAFAAAAASVEYSLFLLGLLFLWSAIDLWRRRVLWRTVLRSRVVDLLWFLLFLTIIWPAGVLKLGLLKSYALQTYIALFRLGEVESGFDSIWSMLLGKFSPSPLELVLLSAGLVALLMLLRRIFDSGSLFVMSGLIAAILVTQATPSLVLPWYLFPVFAPVFVVVYHRFWTTRGWSATVEFRTAIAAALILFGVAQATVELEPYLRSRQVREVVARLPGLDIITVQGLAPPMAAYFPEREVTGYLGVDLDRPEFRDSIERWGADRLLILLSEGAWHPSPRVAVPYDTLYDVTFYHPVGIIPRPEAAENE